MTTQRLRDAYERFRAADDVWSAEIAKEAKRRRVWPGDLRYTTDAEKLPGYAAFHAARVEWEAARSEADRPPRRDTP